MNKYKYINYVCFKDNQKNYSFGFNEALPLKTKVVVETIKGIEMGEISEVAIPYSGEDVKPILRVANEKDLENYQQNLIKAKKALHLCEQEARKLKLEMQFLEAEYSLDGKKVTFVYLADGRVDFRELLKVLASKLHCRIELRQVGPRYKAKLVGGVGQCGRKLCCNNFLKSPGLVSINMAKNQLLALNIQKLSGQCGKLKCCLKYEDDLYEELRKDLPRINSKVTYQDKVYKITGYNVLKEEIKIENQFECLFLPIKEVCPEVYEKKVDENV